MGRRLDGSHKCLACEIALETAEFLSREHNDFVAAVNGHVLRPFRAHATDELAEASFGVLQQPSTRATVSCASARLDGLGHLGF